MTLKARCASFILSMTTRAWEEVVQYVILRLILLPLLWNRRKVGWVLYVIAKGLYYCVNVSCIIVVGTLPNLVDDFCEILVGCVPVSSVGGGNVDGEACGSGEQQHMYYWLLSCRIWKVMECNPDSGPDWWSSCVIMSWWCCMLVRTIEFSRVGPM